MMGTIRVLVADDSITVRKRLIETLSTDPAIEVIAEARDGRTATELCQRMRPDVITMDVMMPIMDGVTATEYIMANCPTPTGPDFDFGATPILFKHGAKQILVAGQKSGIVYGVDPDSGRTLWKTAVGAGSPLGGVEWGIGADAKYVFVPNSDIGQIFNEIGVAAGAPPSTEYKIPGKPGLSALDPFSGKIVWDTPAPIAPCHYAGDRSKDYTKGACVRAQKSPVAPRSADRC